MGFVGLDEFSQDINRLTENEPIHLMPAALADKEWTEGLGPGMWSHNVMPRHTPWSAALGGGLHACSGGIPGYIRKATDGAQLIAMGEGAEAVDISHLKRYREESRTYAMNRGLIEGFAEKDPLKLMKYLDVPWEQYGQDWGKLSLADIADATSDATETTDPDIDEEGKAALRSVHQRIRAAAAARATRTANKGLRKAKARVSEDADQAASRAALAAGLDQLRRDSAAK